MRVDRKAGEQPKRGFVSRADKRGEERESMRGQLERAIEKGLSSRKAGGKGVTKGKRRMGCGVRGYSEPKGRFYSGSCAL